MALLDKKENWWDRKSKKNDPQQPEYEYVERIRQENLARQVYEQERLQKQAEMNEQMYGKSVVDGLYNSKEAMANKAYLDQMAAQQKLTGYNSVPISNWDGQNYYGQNMSNGTWSRGYYDERTEAKAKPIIDYVLKLLQSTDKVVLLN